eukprot:4999873-Amphidinium_carterae.1
MSTKTVIASTQEKTAILHVNSAKEAQLTLGHMTCLAVQPTPLRKTDEAAARGSATGAASGSATGAKKSTSSGWTSRGGGSCLAL